MTGTGATATIQVTVITAAASARSPSGNAVGNASPVAGAVLACPGAVAQTGMGGMLALAVLLVLGAVCLGLTGCGLSINGGAGGRIGWRRWKRPGCVYDHGRGRRAGGIAQRDPEPHSRIREAMRGFESQN